MNERAKIETPAEATLFVGLGFVVEEIVVAQTAGNDKVRAMRAAINARHESELKKIADDFAKLAAANAILARTISSVIARHQARKPRV